jgi:hypothetical protein
MVFSTENSIHNQMHGLSRFGNLSLLFGGLGIMMSAKPIE